MILDGTNNNKLKIMQNSKQNMGKSDTISQESSAEKAFYNTNLIFTMIFTVSIVITIATMAKHKIKDHFLRWALIFELLALILELVLCITFCVKAEDVEEGILSFIMQQIFIEIPFSIQLIFFASILFSW